jgi:hypothetical protein
MIWNAAKVTDIIERKTMMWRLRKIGFLLDGDK